MSMIDKLWAEMWDRIQRGTWFKVRLKRMTHSRYESENGQYRIELGSNEHDEYGWNIYVRATDRAWLLVTSCSSLGIAFKTVNGIRHTYA